MDNKFTIYEHSQVAEGQAPVEVAPIVSAGPHAAKDAVEQKIAIDKQRSKITYEAMMKSANEILFATKTVFPFTLFPTTIVVDRNQVSIAVGVFLAVEHYLSFLLKDINNVIVRSGVLFSEIEFEVTGYEKNPPKVNYLENSHAEQIKKIIDGIHIAQASQVDIWQLEKEEVLNLAKKLTYRNNFNHAAV